MWDTPAEAPQFADALSSSLQALGFTPGPSGGAITTLTLGAITWSLGVDGDAVTVLVSNDASALSAAQEALAP